MSLRLWYPLKRDFTNHGCQRADYRNEITDSIGTSNSHIPVGDDGFLFGGKEFNVNDNSFIQDTSETCENSSVRSSARPLLNNLSSACVTNETDVFYMGARCTKSQIIATSGNLNLLRPFTLSANIVGAPHFFFGIGLYKNPPSKLTGDMSSWFNDGLGFVRVNNVPEEKFQLYVGESQYYNEIMTDKTEYKKYMPYRSDVPHNYMIINDDKQSKLSFYVDGVLFHEITGNEYTIIVSDFASRRDEQIFFGLYHIPSNATSKNGWTVGDNGPEANIAINDLRLYDTAISKKQIHEIANNLDIPFKFDEIRYDCIPLFGEKGLSTYQLNVASNTTLKKFNDIFVNTSFDKPFDELRIKVINTRDSSILIDCATPIDLNGCNTGIRRVFFRLEDELLNSIPFKIQGFLESSSGTLEILNWKDHFMYTGDGNDFVFEVNILDNQANSLYIKDIVIRTTECTDDNGCHKVGVVMSDSSQLNFGLRNTKNSVVYSDFNGCPASNTFASNLCNYYNKDGKFFIKRHGLNLSVGRIQGRENQFMTNTFTMNFWVYLSSSSNTVDALYTDMGSCITLTYNSDKKV